MSKPDVYNDVDKGVDNEAPGYSDKSVMQESEYQLNLNSSQSTPISSDVDFEEIAQQILIPLGLTQTVIPEKNREEYMRHTVNVLKRNLATNSTRFCSKETLPLSARERDELAEKAKAKFKDLWPDTFKGPVDWRIHQNWWVKGYLYRAKEERESHLGIALGESVSENPQKEATVPPAVPFDWKAAFDTAQARVSELERANTSLREQLDATIADARELDQGLKEELRVSAEARQLIRETHNLWQTNSNLSDGEDLSPFQRDWLLRARAVLGGSNA